MWWWKKNTPQIFFKAVFFELGSVTGAIAILSFSRISDYLTWTGHNCLGAFLCLVCDNDSLETNLLTAIPGRCRDLYLFCVNCKIHSLLAYLYLLLFQLFMVSTAFFSADYHYDFNFRSSFWRTEKICSISSPFLFAILCKIYCSQIYPVLY